MGRQANGQAWEEQCAIPLAPMEQARQSFYPDASRIFEEIDRFGIGEDGLANLLSSKAGYDFYRAALPPAVDPAHPTPSEREAIQEELGVYREVFRPTESRWPRGAPASRLKAISKAEPQRDLL